MINDLILVSKLKRSPRREWPLLLFQPRLSLVVSAAYKIQKTNTNTNTNIKTNTKTNTMTNSSHMFDWLWQLLTKSIPPLLPHSIYLVILCNHIMFGIIAAHKMIQCKNMWWCDILTYYSAWSCTIWMYLYLYLNTSFMLYHKYNCFQPVGVLFWQVYKIQSGFFAAFYINIFYIYFNINIIKNTVNLIPLA